MGLTRQKQQFSIAGLLFVMVGVGAFFALAPYLAAASGTSPQWALLVAILLLFAWAMIPLRKGSDRMWWIGFLTCGWLYLAIAIVAVPIAERLAVYFGEVVAAFGITAASLCLLFPVGVSGGAVFSALHRTVEDRYKACDDHRSAGEAAK